MISFRPHTLKIKTITRTIDVNGDFVDSVSFSREYSCRFEKSSRAGVISLPEGNGKSFAYEYEVFLNHDCPDVAYDTMIQLYNNGVLVCEKPCKGYVRNQLDAKLWL